MALMRLAVQGGGASRIADCGGVQEMLSKLAQVNSRRLGDFLTEQNR